MKFGISLVVVPSHFVVYNERSSWYFFQCISRGCATSVKLLVWIAL